MSITPERVLGILHMEEYGFDNLTSFEKEEISACLKSYAELRKAYDEIMQAEVIGAVGSMPGTDGFTMAAFKASDVPCGTQLIIKPEPLKD